MRKLLFFLAIFSSIAFFSCKKDHDSKTRTEILTSKTWVYNEYFTNYNQAATVLQYKKGKANNLLNLSGDKLKFESNGTYSRVDYNGQTQTGTWQWMNNESKVSTTEGGITHSSNTIVLTDDMYTWYDDVEGTYGEMVPQ